MLKSHCEKACGGAIWISELARQIVEPGADNLPEKPAVNFMN